MDMRTMVAGIVYHQDDHRTNAKITAEVRGKSFTGHGWARRNPADPQMPEVGEELALARALADLAEQLLNVASETIADREGHKVLLHL